MSDSSSSLVRIVVASAPVTRTVQAGPASIGSRQSVPTAQPPEAPPAQPVRGAVAGSGAAAVQAVRDNGTIVAVVPVDGRGQYAFSVPFNEPLRLRVIDAQGHPLALDEGVRSLVQLRAGSPDMILVLGVPGKKERKFKACYVI